MTGKVFVPFSEELLEQLDEPLGELVPFHLEYKCVRLLDDGEEQPITATDIERSLEACIAVNS